MPRAVKRGRSRAPAVPELCALRSAPSPCPVLFPARTDPLQRLCCPSLPPGVVELAARKLRALEVGSRLGPAGPGAPHALLSELWPLAPGYSSGSQRRCHGSGARIQPAELCGPRGPASATPGLPAGSPGRSGLGAGCGSGGLAPAVTVSCDPASLQVERFPTSKRAVWLRFTNSCQRLRAVGFPVSWGDCCVCSRGSSPRSPSLLQTFMRS